MLDHNFSLQVATVNGSGSQSSNQILVRSLFRMGVPVGAKNLFPSNIQGLPTWFTIRVNEKGFTSRTDKCEIVIAMNPQTVGEDIGHVKPGGVFIYNSEIKGAESQLDRSDIHIIKIPFKDVVAEVTDSIRMKKLLVNMAYVGVLAEWLQIPPDVLNASIEHQFKGKESVIAPNRQAVLAGREYAKNHPMETEFPFRAKSIENGNKENILIDGNSAAALGLLFGGCTVACWYPITPSSSLIENFSRFCEKYRRNKNEQRSFSIIQAEDELAAISMVIGAGWAGARAMTATSGPGLSLMAEAAGLAYYAEVPTVIWNVQRVGPSTGLPTRTMQGDLMSSYTLSHGDTQHVVLLPSHPLDCFEFGQLAFDLAERLQTLVIVLSDLDLGMNLHMSPRPQYPSQPFDRGKVLSSEDLEKMENFGRYLDVDGDGIPYRAWPGTENEKAGYFTRGSGHDFYGRYTESSEIYKANMTRLKQKFETARGLVPKPIVKLESSSKIGLIYYGSTSECIEEAATQLDQKAVPVSQLCLRALPFSSEVGDFISSFERIYVVEQNRDAQLLSLLRMEFPQFASKMTSVLQYDGLPLTALEVSSQILTCEENRGGKS